MFERWSRRSNWAKMSVRAWRVKTVPNGVCCLHIFLPPLLECSLLLGLWCSGTCRWFQVLREFLRRREERNVIEFNDGHDTDDNGVSADKNGMWMRWRAWWVQWIRVKLLWSLLWITERVRRAKGECGGMNEELMEMLVEIGTEGEGASKIRK